MNATALVSASGTVVERYVYDPYGKATFLDGDWQPTVVEGHGDGTVSVYASEILYAGYRFDPETGLYQVRMRYYHPTMGTFTSRDPARYADTCSLYEYCRANPLRSADPSGLGPLNRLLIWLGLRDKRLVEGPIGVCDEALFVPVEDRKLYTSIHISLPPDRCESKADKGKRATVGVNYTVVKMKEGNWQYTYNYNVQWQATCICCDTSEDAETITKRYGWWPDKTPLGPKTLIKPADVVHLVPAQPRPQPPGGGVGLPELGKIQDRIFKGIGGKRDPTAIPGLGGAVDAVKDYTTRPGNDPLRDQDNPFPVPGP
jgi:RHS repeat-associated protein